MAAAEVTDRMDSEWRDRARALQLRIRDRFRIAVDRHRQWSEESDYSAALQRWVLRLRAFLENPTSSVSSSNSSSPYYKFYRKRVHKDVDLIADSVIVRLLQAVAVPIIGNACHVFMHGLNHVQIYGAEKLHHALVQRPDGTPLITVSNHVASVDDPLIVASLLPPNTMLDARNLRWTLCATDRCFKNPMLSAFFRCVKVLPVSRGEGIYQKGMDMAISKLNNGGWVHIFPEGSRSRDGGKTIGSPKRGVGRLVMDADSVPVVIPFVHTGMQDIMPIGSSIPKIGKRVIVVVGDPIHLEDLLQDKDGYQNDSRGVLYDAVSSRIGHRLQELKVQVDRLALEQSFEVREYYMHNAARANGIWQQVDWEAFGIENVMSSDNTQIQISPTMTKLKENLDQPRHQRLDYRATIKMGFSYDGGIVSRVRGYMNPSELMGFAARGLFLNGRVLDKHPQSFQEPGPSKIWKQFLERNLFSRRNAL
ncbi:hypothetical protein J5N97_015289 [Dioscorea zingiberensis]|uniref:Phospholipid/glycerol acyltransferase domain-containing protein n=1 Tax=Dioscorea zingiberensis TaxID=325984 RepID=A0A9D5HKB8_9LILI|nr:hypothetical protein J5N97_015289 [Dioscorea zingiberensis]